jgi:hypothetical protein
MSITQLVESLVELGWYAKTDLYVNSNISDSGMATVAVPAMMGNPFLVLVGWPVFRFHPVFETWSGFTDATQENIDWLKQVVSQVVSYTITAANKSLEPTSTARPA